MSRYTRSPSSPKTSSRARSCTPRSTTWRPTSWASPTRRRRRWSAGWTPRRGSSRTARSSSPSTPRSSSSSISRRASRSSVNAGPAAILGNGSLLATLSARGDVERLFWPSLDRGSHIGGLRFGVALDGATEQAYLHDANVLLTRNGGVEVVDLVHELEPVLLRRIRG